MLVAIVVHDYPTSNYAQRCLCHCQILHFNLKIRQKSFIGRALLGPAASQTPGWNKGERENEEKIEEGKGGHGGKGKGGRG